MGRGFKTLILYKLHNYRRNWTTTVDNLRQVAVSLVSYERINNFAYWLTDSDEYRAIFQAIGMSLLGNNGQ
jgi:hypothetical protein